MCGRGILEQQSKEDAQAAVSKLRAKLVTEGVPHEWSDLVAVLGAEDAVMHAPRARYNIAPTDWIPTLELVAGEKMLTDTRWGVHFPPRRSPTFNARQESLDDPAWAPLHHEGRVVHVLSGFYEWRGGDARDPVYVRLANGEPMRMAALSKDVESHSETATITQGAPEWFAPIHDRFPMVLDAEQSDEWLNGTLTPGRLKTPFSADDFEVRPVHTDVNKSTNDGPELIRRRATLF